MKTKKCITILSYIYIALPVLIFFFGVDEALSCIARMLDDTVRLLEGFGGGAGPLVSGLEQGHDSSGLYHCGNYWTLGIFFGNWRDDLPKHDHWWRNQTFQILVEYDWPVTKQVMMEDGVHTRGLIYYIGFWLPAACVGKLFGLTAGYCFQLLWAALGVGLVYYYICAYLKRLSVWPLFGLILFSGLDILGYYMIGRDLGN